MVLTQPFEIPTLDGEESASFHTTMVLTQPGSQI